MLNSIRRYGRIASPASPVATQCVPAIHVVSRQRHGLFVALGAALGHRADLRHWGVLPRLRGLAAGDTVVLDLLDLPAEVRCAEAVALMNVARVLAIAGDGPVDGIWLSAASRSQMRVVYCDAGSRRGGFQLAIAALAESLGGRCGHAVAQRVVARAPTLAGARELVIAVCANPWQVRRPADLAAAAGQRRQFVLRRCSALGFVRVEHFITMVRLLMLEEHKSGLPSQAGAPWRDVGVHDVSNFRRQVARARRGSHGVFANVRLCLCAALVSASLAGAACGPGNASVPVQIETTGSSSVVPLPVSGELVRRGDLVLSIHARGLVRSERQVTLRADAPGTVIRVDARPGQRVAAGQLLIELDPRPFDLTLRQAEGSVAEARMRELDMLLGDRSSDTTAIALQRRSSARLRSGLVGAEARLEQAQLDRERATISAPFAGVLDAVDAVSGQRLVPGDPIGRLVDLDSLSVEANVLEHDLQLIRPGNAASVLPAGGQGARFAGLVLAVLPLVDTIGHNGRVLVRTGPGREWLRPGMFVDVELETSRLSGRMLVPGPALVERDGRTLVFRARNGRAEWVYVTPGRSNGSETEIVPDARTGHSQLRAGDTVLVRGHGTLSHDAPIVLDRRAVLPR